MLGVAVGWVRGSRGGLIEGAFCPGQEGVLVLFRGEGRMRSVGVRVERRGEERKRRKEGGIKG